MVFHLGVGDRGFLSTTVHYSPEEQAFPPALAAALTRAPHECCRVELLVVAHDPTATLAENAAAVAEALDRKIDEAVQGSPWLTQVNLHLVGFSAGGLLALDVASRVRVAARVRTAAWCRHDMAREVPVEMDLVTLAAPFDLSIPFAGTVASGLPWTYESSVGASEYVAPAAERLCSFTAFVSSKRHGDKSRAADRDPREDARLHTLWNGLNPTRRRVELLREAYTPADPDDPHDPERVTHLQVLERVLADSPWALVPRCHCVQTF
jgi:hypothetical protein